MYRNQAVGTAWALLVALVCGCIPASTEEPPSRPALPSDRYAVSALPVRYLSQNWTPAQSLEFYAIRQGSPIMRKQFFDALEQPAANSDERPLFRESSYLASFGFLPQGKHSLNPDGYPIGFVASAAIELNCAACHTSRLVFNDVEYRIDGSQAKTDVDSWLAALVTALAQTVKDAPRLDDLQQLPASKVIPLDASTRFGRFASRILGDNASQVSQIYPIVVLLRRDYERRQRYEDYNHHGRLLTESERESAEGHPPYGFYRLDALNAILNQACAEDLNRPDNAAVADAPVNYPMIWDAPQHARVQWNGAVDNRKLLGPLGRNAGQVIGVFGLADVDGDAWVGYDSSIRFSAIRRAEQLITTLWSPQWPQEFGIDRDLAATGQAVYRKSCVACHAIIKRDDPNRDPKDMLIPVGREWLEYPKLDTDPRTANQFATRLAAVGPLAGRYSGKPLGPRFPAGADQQVLAQDILSHIVARTIVRSFVPWRKELTLDDEGSSDIMLTEGPQQQEAKYKSRPLNGVWSTAPYLHNGSVLNMQELLKPPAERLKTFQLGADQFDPKTLGYINEGSFEFNTDLDGNHNTGHEYGTDLTDGEKAALIEFIKTL
ncbi:di-heme-cytochrome C peroxidase [Stieleria sp. TO1_6]|uniref:di-heme-cytochrome C peroxidase n=1 Tax=Stieleria tagensis TaxID=2956795 RepID=UPI00209AA1A1|nr:di-heme-cytochrome C peroxidase [Stieleria tagensis]MCO8124445.1 di-heme-cytochrome C peroxidase [Stieleria tagensis]